MSTTKKPAKRKDILGDGVPAAAPPRHIMSDGTVWIGEEHVREEHGPVAASSHTKPHVFTGGMPRPLSPREVASMYVQCPLCRMRPRGFRLQQHLMTKHRVALPGKRLDVPELLRMLREMGF